MDIHQRMHGMWDARREENFIGIRERKIMNAKEIRLANELCQNKCIETTTLGAQQAGLDSLKASMLTEIAAQLAEVKEFLKIYSNPPMVFEGANITPDEFPDLPQPITFRPVEPRATLRDQFAMAALTGLLSDPTSSGPEGCAKAAYLYADAMLEVR
jgi:hypothetical protein